MQSATNELLLCVLCLGDWIYIKVYLTMKKGIPKQITTLNTAYYSSPIGILKISGTEENIISVHFLDSNPEQDYQLFPLLENCIMQLDEYFHYKRQKFHLPLMPQGTSFQKQVWERLAAIPYGTTRSYLQIASQLGNPKAIRAVGGANGKNPIAIIIPCHRVIGTNGKLVGYGGGLWRKEWLLKHELTVML